MFFTLVHRSPGLRRIGILASIIFALSMMSCATGRTPIALASQTECFSYGYACTPGYDATNTEGGWAWKYYGGSYAATPTGYHNCTLYAAWRLEQNGMANPGLWGNAVEWIDHTSHNNTPAVGSIAWWGSEVGGGFGHVAYVEQVRGSEVFIRADNYDESGGYTDAGWVPDSSVDAFLHPHDIGGSGGREPDGAFIKVTGAPAIYRVIGGAPVHVDSCTPLGGCPGLVEVPNLSGYATEPENGSYMRMANGPLEGLIARVAGGDALGLATCEGLPGCSEAINLDEGGFNEYVAAHQTVASGTFVRVADGPKTGLIGRSVGGALLGLQTCEGDMDGCQGAVNVAENAYDTYAEAHQTIASGTFVRIGFGANRGLVGRSVGGDVLGLQTCEGDMDGCPGQVNIDENAWDRYAEAHTTIASGTFVRVGFGANRGLIGRSVGGDVLGLATCEGMESEGCASAINIDENAYNTYVSEYHVISNGTFVRVADGPNTGLIGRVVGSVLLGLQTCEGIEGCDSAVNVAENAYLYYASEFHTVANGTFVRVADGPHSGLIARAAGGALLGLTTCEPLEECPGAVNIDANAFNTYTSEHPTPANGTIVEGLPSGAYWSFLNGERATAPPSAEAVAVDDSSLASYPIKAQPTGTAPTTVTSSTNTSGIPIGGQVKSSPSSHGVLGTKTSKSSIGSSALTRALAKCRKIKNRRKRTKCETTARHLYDHELQLARQQAIAACKHIKNPAKQKACVSDAERRYG